MIGLIISIVLFGVIVAGCFARQHSSTRLVLSYIQEGLAVAMAFIQFGWGNYFCCMCDVAIAGLAIYYILKQHNPNSERR